MSECFVYLIAHKDGDNLAAPVKVGISKSASSRLATLQTGNPRELGLVFAFWTPHVKLAKSLEGRFHRVFNADRLVGEWFDIEPNYALGRLVICLWAELIESFHDEPDHLATAFEATGFNEAIALVKPRGAVH